MARIQKERMAKPAELTSARVAPVLGNDLPAFKSGLDKILVQLRDLMGEDDYDEMFLRPTAYAADTAQRLLIDSCPRLGLLLPPAAVYPDGNGGIRIEWKRGRRHLRLVVSSKPETGYYLFEQNGKECKLYEQNGKEFKGADNASAPDLRQCLRWLTDEKLSSPEL